MKRFSAFAAAIGAAFMYFFDPQNGRRRRNMAPDRTLAFFRRGGRRAERLGRGVAAEAQGVAQKAAHRREEPKPQPDDATLAQKVESDVFRDVEVAKGQINVNAEDGKVILRGEVERPELLEELVERTRKVQGVRDVESRLHVPERS